MLLPVAVRSTRPIGGGQQCFDAKAGDRGLALLHGSDCGHFACFFCWIVVVETIVEVLPFLVIWLIFFWDRILCDGHFAVECFVWFEVTSHMEFMTRVQISLTFEVTNRSCEFSDQRSSR